MESETYAGNGLEVVPEVITDAVESSEWPERVAQAKTKKSKQTSSQARVSQLLESLNEIDARRFKLEIEREDIKKQLATAVTNL